MISTMLAFPVPFSRSRYRSIRRCAARYDGDRYAQRRTCRQQFLAMAFAQLTYRESLRTLKLPGRDWT